MKQHARLQCRQRICIYYFSGQTHAIRFADQTERCCLCIRSETFLRTSERLGQLLHSLVLEELPDIQLQACGARPRDHLNRKNRIATEIKEVILNTDSLCSQHLPPGITKHHFSGGARCDVRSFTYN